MEVVTHSKSKSAFSSFFGSSKDVEKPASVKLLEEASGPSSVPTFTGNSGYGADAPQYVGASGSSVFGNPNTPTASNSSSNGYSAPTPSTESFKPTEPASNKRFYDEEVNPFAG